MQVGFLILLHVDSFKYFTIRLSSFVEVILWHPLMVLQVIIDGKHGVFLCRRDLCIFIIHVFFKFR